MSRPVSPRSAIEQPSAEECRALLERVLASNQLRRSERQREFLSFVCNIALNEPGRDIREVEVGTAVFGRAPNYDTAQDNLVRVNASELRRKLEDYFNTDGADEPLVLTIPRGGYRPLFARRSVPSAEHAPVAAALMPVEAPPPVVAAPQKRSHHRWWLPLATFAIGAAITATVMYRWDIRSTGKTSHPVVARFWERLFVADRPTEIVLADSCLSLYQDLARTSLTLDNYLKHQYLTQLSGESRVAAPELELIMSRRYTSLADVQLLNRITVIAYPPDRHPTTIHFARDFPAENLGKANVIIVGSKRSNPWAEPFEKSMDFRFEYDAQMELTTIRNLRPGAGEQSSYVQKGTRADSAESYAIVALLPNLRQSGNVLLFSGAGMDATQAAGEFMTSERWVAQLGQKLSARKDGTLPYFEALLYAKRLGGGSVAEIELRALHIH
jgi:hypothetical protein